MNDEHTICTLRIELAELKQKSKDDDKALILAKDVASAKWTSILALVSSLIALAAALFKK